MLLAPSMPGGQRITYTLEVIRDQKPPRVELYFEDGPGDQPPQWGELIDLARPE